MHWCMTSLFYHRLLFKKIRSNDNANNRSSAPKNSFKFEQMNLESET